MASSQRNKSESGLRGKGKRYWSIMLVGEHGRVIPFRRFKEIAVTVIAVACLSLAALAIIAYFYVQQDKTMRKLSSEVDALRRQTVQLKDEKDVLHAKLVIQEMQKAPAAVQKTKGKENGQPDPKALVNQGTLAPALKEAQPVAAVPTPSPQPTPTPTATATPTPAPSVNWRLALERFDADYDARRELIKFNLRVLNKTVPRQSLSGRMVLVVKKSNEAPKQWVAVPSVPLVEGKPTGKTGQAFTVQNYRTMDFKLYKQRPPIAYDTATVFVFNSNGELLLSQDFSFKVAVPVQRLATPAPTVEATPTLTPAPTSTPLSAPDLVPSLPAMTPSSPLVPEAGGKAGDSVKYSLPNVGSPAPGGSPAESMAPRQDQPRATGTPTTPAPVISPLPIPEKNSEIAPSGEPAQPKSQGER